MALLSVSALGFAQSAKFGIKGGVNFADVSASAESFSASLGTLTTYNVGVFADFKLGAVSLQPGLFYTGKGFDAVTSSTDQVKMSLKYVQVPVNLVYHVPLVVGNIFFGAGPYAAIAVSGKVTAKSGGASLEQDVTFGDGPDDTKKNEFGLQGIAGFQFKQGFLIGLNYDLGLSDISNGTDGSSIKNRVFGVSVGYSF